MIRALIFDFNGVLIDDEHLHFDLFREVLAEEDVFITSEMYHQRYLGFDDRKCLETALADAGKSNHVELVDELIERKAKRYVVRAADGLRIFPGAKEALQSLGTRWPIAICSGALRAEVELGVRLLDAENVVLAIAPAEETEKCKPDPDGYILALERLKVLPNRTLANLKSEECLVIEDSLAGIMAAKSAGMLAVGISNTYNDADLRGAGADDVVADLWQYSASWIDSRFSNSNSK